MKLMKIMMMSCKEASELSVKKSYDGLTLTESLKFKLHTKMCKACLAYHQQNELLDKKIAELLEQRRKEHLHLTEVQKTSIKKAVVG